MDNKEKLWTTGAWKVKDQFTVIIGNDGNISGSLNTQATGVIGSGVKEREANAHLIAAAPELYEALEMLMEWQVKNVSALHNEAYDNAYKALAKARGEM